MPVEPVKEVDTDRDEDRQQDDDCDVCAVMIVSSLGACFGGARIVVGLSLFCSDGIRTGLTFFGFSMIFIRKRRLDHALEAFRAGHGETIIES